MYEYMNPGFILMAGLISFLTLITVLVMLGKSQVENVEFKHPYILYFFTIVVVGMLYWNASDTKESILSNTSIFNSNHELQCSTLTENYLVSKSKGWYMLDKKSFTDGNLILSIELCEGI